jgi:hypothetical protein
VWPRAAAIPMASCVFTVVDKDNNVLFTNKDQGNAPYWDLSVTNTIDVTHGSVA